MKYQKLPRFICLILAVIMLLPTAVACAETGTSNETTAGNAETKAPAASETVAETESPYDAEGYLKDNLPESLNYGNQEVAVLHWNDADYEEFFAASENGEIVNDAIYQRNSKVEARLDIQLKFVGTAGDTNNEAAFASFLGNSISAGEKAYDVVGAYSYTAGLCTVQNLYYDMTDVNYLDFEKPWWPSNLIEQSTINNKLGLIPGKGIYVPKRKTIIARRVNHNLLCKSVAFEKAEKFTPFAIFSDIETITHSPLSIILFFLLFF